MQTVVVHHRHGGNLDPHFAFAQQAGIAADADPFSGDKLPVEAVQLQQFHPGLVLRDQHTRIRPAGGADGGLKVHVPADSRT